MKDVFFRGYIETKDKQAVEKFKNRTDFKTYEQVERLPEFAGILAEDTILIDIDDFDQSEALFKMVKDRSVKCRVYRTTRGKHFLFYNKGVENCKTHTKLAVGLDADIKIGTKSTYEVLKFDGKEREVLYDADEYEYLPFWLLPVKSKTNFFDMENGDGRNQSLFNYILTLQDEGLSVDECRDCIRMINKYIFTEPLEEDELETILRDESFQKPSFFKKGQFLFDKFAKYLVDQHHIIRINGQLHLYRDGIYIDGYGEIESLMIEYIPNLNRQKRKEVLDYIDIMIRKNTAPSDAGYIAFRNGIYNIETEEFTDFSPDIIITNKIGFDYNPEAYSEIVDKTLNKLACDDKQIRELLEEVVGYTFYRRNELRKAFILTGEKSNGKSTFIDMVENLLGDRNTSALDLGELGDRFKTAELFGKLANLGDDIGDDFVSNTAVLKKLISGDRVNVERKTQNPFDFNCYAKFLFSANSIPRMGRGKDSGAIIDRLIIVPFNATFSKDDPDYDPYIKYKLRSQESMEYLIQIALDGLWRVLQSHKFTTCDVVNEALTEYAEENNPLLIFFAEHFETEFVNNSVADAYRKYTEFCIDYNIQPIGKIQFGKQLRKRYDLDTDTKKIDGKAIKIYVKKFSENS